VISMPPRKKAAEVKVDETVKNQENPGSSTEDRTPDEAPAKDAMENAAKAQDVDVTVHNQESLGSAEVKDRNPGPQLVEDPTTGGIYDVSKADRELVDPDREETEARRARLRQTEGVMNAKDIEGEDDQDGSESTLKFSVEFLESGFTVLGKVWKKGEILVLADSEETRNQNKDSVDSVWYELSTSEQKDRFGKVFFEKR
jgi:hypothetical protein